MSKDRHRPPSMFLSHENFSSRAWHKGIPLGNRACNSSGGRWWHDLMCHTLIWPNKKKQPHCTYHYTTLWLHSVGLGITWASISFYFRIPHLWGCVLCTFRQAIVNYHGILITSPFCGKESVMYYTVLSCTFCSSFLYTLMSKTHNKLFLKKWGPPSTDSTCTIDFPLPNAQIGRKTL